MEEKKKIKRPFRALSLDGGGMRGLYTASLLQELSQRFRSENSEDRAFDIGKGFSLIVGTSTGGILATALFAGISINEIIDMYVNKGPKIFNNPIPRGKFRTAVWAIKHSLSSANKDNVLKETLNKIFKNKTIGEAYRKRKIGLCVCSIKLIDHKPRVFKTNHNSGKHADDNRKLSDICLATSAAPIILPIANTPDSFNNEYFVDGGLWANNPVMIALLEAMEIAEKDQPIEIISIGTCPPPSGGSLSLSKKNNKGMLYWDFGIKALELSMHASSQGSQFCAQFLQRFLNEQTNRNVKVIRLESTPPSSDQAEILRLDNASTDAVDTLLQLGKEDARQVHSKSMNKSEDDKILQEIFSCLPTIDLEEVHNG